MAKRSFLPAALFAVIMFAGHTIPTDRWVRFSRKSWIFAFLLSDEFLHFLVFGLLTGLLCYGFYKSRRQRFPCLIILLISFSYGILIEIWQLLLPYRSFQVRDIIMDLAGILAGMLLFWLLGYRRKIPERNFK